MKIEILGASGSETPGRNLPALLIDGSILLDAGTIGLALDGRGQSKITHIFITHAHLDHVKGLPFLLENLAIANSGHSVTLFSGGDVLAEIKKHILNGRIWPDFTAIPDRRRPTLRLRAIHPDRAVSVSGYRISCVRVSHPVPAYGYIIGKPDGGGLAYTGDTGPTDLFWHTVSKRGIDCLIAEVSFPDSMVPLAGVTGHLTPSLLKAELRKMARTPPRIFVMHAKTHVAEISKEMRLLGMEHIGMLEDGQVIML